MTDLKLRQAFTFEKEDLEANRHGRFSARQRRSLLRESAGGVPLFAGIAFLMAAVVGLLLQFSLANTLLLGLILAAGLLSFFVIHTRLLLWGIGVARGRIMLTQQRSGEVPAMVSIWRPSATGDYYRLDVAEHFFYLSPPAYQALKAHEGADCAVYFFYRDPKWYREILSVEIL